MKYKFRPSTSKLYDLIYYLSKIYFKKISGNFLFLLMPQKSSTVKKNLPFAIRIN